MSDFEYIPQDVTSGYARHDLGKAPQRYTQDEVDEVALMDGEDYLISVHDQSVGKDLPDTYVRSNPFDGTAIKRGGRKVINVAMEPKEGIYVLA